LLKLASSRHPVGELVFFRSSFALLPVFAWVAWRDWHVRAVYDVFRTTRFTGHVIRSAFGVVGMYLGFWALTLLPIADATAIGYASPLLTVAFAAILLGEKVYVFRWTAVAVGLVGVLVMIFGYLETDASGPDRSFLGAGVAVAAAFTGALAATYTRSLTRYESAATIVVYFSAATALAGLASLPLGWVWPQIAWSMPSAVDATWLILAGIFGGIGQVLMTQSFRFGDAGTIAPFDYTSMIWVLIVSVVVFNQWPGAPILVGTAIVIGAGLFVIWREHRLGIERARSKRAQTPTTPLS
jgi:drug/metabolite transporter (DMT)-like permease